MAVRVEGRLGDAGEVSQFVQQTRTLGASLADRPAAFLGSVPSTTLKVAGIELFCCGRVHQEDGEDELLALDTRRGHYRRLLVKPDGRLAGAILLGDLRDAQALRTLLTDGEPVPADLLNGFGASSRPSATVDDLDPSMNICSCQGVTRGEIVHAIRDRKLTTVPEVAEYTRASTGCGGCRPDLEQLLNLTHRPEAPATTY